MRRIFTDYGTIEEAELFNQLKVLQTKIKYEKHGYPTLAIQPRNEEDYAIGTRLVEIFNYITSKDLKNALKCIITLYNELKDTYNNTKVQS